MIQKKKRDLTDVGPRSSPVKRHLMKKRKRKKKKKKKDTRRPWVSSRCRDTNMMEQCSISGRRGDGEAFRAPMSKKPYYAAKRDLKQKNTIGRPWRQICIQNEF